jgi:hypothetical protein
MSKKPSDSREPKSDYLAIDKNNKVHCQFDNLTSAERYVFIYRNKNLRIVIKE